MKRRDLLQTLAAAGGAAALSAPSSAPAETVAAVALRAALDDAIQRLASLPVDQISFALEIARAGSPLRLARNADQPLFIGSAVKTFVLAQFLREVEDDALVDAQGTPADYYDEQSSVAVDDVVRTAGSPVLLGIEGEIPWFAALEAMITHSDNTGTDIAIATAGIEKIRALIAQAGLANTRIAASMRRLLSYISGAPYGVDIGWEGVVQVAEGHFPGTPRSPFNTEETLVSTASEMLSWYRQTLSGKCFTKPQTLREYKRLLAMCHVIAEVMPADTVGYAKNGWIDWQGFHAQCIPGQMIVRDATITFCFTINWTQADTSIADATIAAYREAVTAVLQAASDFAKASAPFPVSRSPCRLSYG